MNDLFWLAKPQNLDWVSWCGGCLLYDGDLNVVREPFAYQINVKSLDGKHTIKMNHDTNS